MITLRPKQVIWYDKIRRAFLDGFRAPLAQAPTGFGKTRVFSEMAHSAEKRGKRVLILCHRVELIDQIVDALKDCDVYPDIIAAGYARRCGGRSTGMRGNHSVAVASVQTLVRRLDDYPAPTLIIIDECHHVTVGGTWHTIISKYPDAKLLGVSATPSRTDCRGLGETFDTLILGPTVRELIEDGHLAKPRVFAPPTVDTSGLHIRAGDYKTEEAEALMDVPAIIGSALAHYKQHANGLPALVFCTSVAHAYHVAEQFRNDGISALSLNGGTDKEIRRMALADFRENKIKVITSVDIFSEGVDIVGCHVGIFLRPTASLGLYLQQCGRILRPAPGKSHALLFDHVSNVTRFGLPDADREWTLTDDAERRKKKPPPSIRVCVKCFAASPARALVCVECGHVFEVKPRQEVVEKDGDLIELTAEMIAKKQTRQEQGRSRSLDELRQYAKRKGYKPGWADAIHKARERKQRSRSA